MKDKKFSLQKINRSQFGYKHRKLYLKMYNMRNLAKN